MLSAEEIINKSKKESKLPDSGGPKFFANEHTNEQTESIFFALNQLKTSLLEERIVKKSLLTVARWCDETQLGVVEFLKGHTSERFGHQTRDGFFLEAEECLFLLDQGTLELKYQGAKLSVQEAFILLLPLLPSVEYYQVYSYLCKLGFNVQKYKEGKGLDDGDVRNDGPDDVIGSFDNAVENNAETEVKSLDEKSLEVLESGYMKDLWCGVDIPLVKPCDARSTASSRETDKHGRIC